MAQALTNKKFIEQMDDVIEELGGTPTNLQLTADKEDDMLSNGAFAAKMDEVVEALGGTPAELTISDDEADDMVSDHIFQLKMEDVVKNMSGGGGGGSSDFSTAQVTFVADSFSQDGGNVSNFIYINDTYLETVYETALEGEYTAVCYKGEGYAFVPTVVSVSGNATINGNDVTITGDCTIHYVAEEII